MRVWQRWRKWERGHIPEHLARLYPADFSLFLLNIALFLDGVSEPSIGTVVHSGVAGGAGLLLLHGWLMDRPFLTVGGAGLSAIVWLVELVEALAQVGTVDSVALAASVVGLLAALNLSLGLAWVVSDWRSS